MQTLHREHRRYELCAIKLKSFLLNPSSSQNWLTDLHLVKVNISETWLPIFHPKSFHSPGRLPVMTAGCVVWYNSVLQSFKPPGLGTEPRKPSSTEAHFFLLNLHYPLRGFPEWLQTLEGHRVGNNLGEVVLETWSIYSVVLEHYRTKTNQGEPFAPRPWLIVPGSLFLRFVIILQFLHWTVNIILLWYITDPQFTCKYFPTCSSSPCLIITNYCVCWSDWRNSTQENSLCQGEFPMHKKKYGQSLY